MSDLRERADAALKRVAEQVRREGPSDGRFKPPSLEECLAFTDSGPTIPGRAILHRFKRLRDRK